MSEVIENEIETGEGAESVEETKTDGRHIWVEHPVYTDGERVKRAEWIRNVYGTESDPVTVGDKTASFYGNRGHIAKALSEMEGKDVPYQIVFAATKDNPEPAAALKAAKAAAKEEAEASAAIEHTEDEE